MIVGKNRLNALRILCLAPFVGLLGSGCQFLPISNPPGVVTSRYEIEPDGHGPGRDVVAIDWCNPWAEQIGNARVVYAGYGTLGPNFLYIDAADDTPNDREFDGREWQWWKGYEQPASTRFLRDEVQAKGGTDFGPGGIRIWSHYETGAAATTEEWFFRDLVRHDAAFYDCLITVRNVSEEPIKGYGQLFSSFCNWNKESGHYYWALNGEFVNFLGRGSRHLDYYVTRENGLFDRLGAIPGCPRGDGKIKDLWKHPVSVSQPGPDDFRHIIMVEENHAAALAMGDKGLAQVYVIYPGELPLIAGDSFTVHVRHVMMPVRERDLAEVVAKLWRKFEADRRAAKSWSRYPAKAPSALMKQTK